MRKMWFIMSAIFIVGFVILVVNIPRVLDGVFEKSTRILEQKVMKEVPAEYSLRIRKDFDCFISAFKEKKLKREDLTKFSDLMKSANEDGKLEQMEINELLEFIETVTSGLK